VPLPAAEFEQRTLKFTLTKSKRKESQFFFQSFSFLFKSIQFARMKLLQLHILTAFGIVLGCKYYIKHITNPKLADKDPGLKEGDTVVSINGQPCEALNFADASKLIEKARSVGAI
jgi:hypothetical protein